MNRHYLILIIVFSFCISFIYCIDDDFEFITSLGNAGYFWLAEKELEKLKESENETEKVLALRGLARLCEKKGDYRERDRWNMEFLKLGQSSIDPRVKREVEIVKKYKWDYMEETLRKLVSVLMNIIARGEENEKQKEAKRLRFDIKRIGEDIIRYRRSIVEKYEKMAKRNDDDEIQFDQAKFFFAKTVYYYSFAFVGDDEERRQEVLNEAHDVLQNLVFMWGDRVILIPLFAGLVLYEQEKYKQAATSFIMVIDFPVDPKFDEPRKEAYVKAVECYYKIKDFKECALTASNYLIEFPREEDKTNFRGHSIRLNVALAVWDMEPTDYDAVKGMLDFKGPKDEEVQKLLVEIEAENGPKSSEARRILAEIATGYIKHIASGVEKFNAKEYDKAASAFQKGLKEVPAGLSIETRITKLAQAWYYLGFSYYYRDMYLPAIICFKEGTTRFLKDFREYGHTLSPEKQQWFLTNRDNWKNIAGKYYKEEKSDLSLEIFKEALITYGQIKGTGDDEEDAGVNVYINLAIIQLREDDFQGALEQLEKVRTEDPDYLKAVRLKGQCKWGKYVKEGMKNSQLAKEAFGYYDYVVAALEKKLSETDGDEERKSYEGGLANIRGRLIGMWFKSKKYKKIINGIDTFWEYPPKNKRIGVTVAQQQIYSVIKVGVSDKDFKELKKQISLMLKCVTILEMMKHSFAEFQDKILATTRTLGFGFYNMGLKLLKLDKKDDSKLVLNKSGEMLFSFIMEAGDNVKEGELLFVADVLHNKVKDFERSEKVTDRIIEIYEARTMNRYPPYDKKTQALFESMKAELFDTNSARSKWDRFIDRMYDGEDAEGKKRDREYFQNRKKEFWDEKPYMYGKAYELLSEVIMLELGFSPEEIAKKGKKERDGNNPDAFWKSIFAQYEKEFQKDASDLKNIHEFLDSIITVHNFKSRLAECYLHNRRFKEASEIFKELSNYYINEPSSKMNLADAYLEIARQKKKEAEKISFAMQAKDLYIWIKTYSTPDLQGRKSHYDAVLKVAECYDVAGDVEAAYRVIDEAIRYGTEDYPPGYEEKLKKKKSEYKKQLSPQGQEVMAE